MPTVLSVFGLVPLRVGGVECFVRELSLQLDRVGWRHVAAFTGPPADEVKRYLDLPNLSLEMAPELCGSRLAAACAFSGLVRRHRPAIVHLHFLSPVSFYPWLTRLHGTKKIFFTHHGSHPIGFVPRRAPCWKRLLGRMIVHPVTGLFCVSRYTQAYVRLAGYYPVGKLHILYNGVTPPLIEHTRVLGTAFRRRYAIPPEAELVVQVSWIMPEKGVGDALEAARVVLERRPSAHFAFVGDGAHLEEYRQRACDLEIAHRVTWTGLVKNPLSEGAYDAADVSCLASWQEACPYVVIEAMASARPIVATRVGGIPEIVEDGRTGYLVPPADPASLADRILRLLEDAPLRHRMGFEARRVAQARFELSSQVRRLLESFYGLAGA